MDTELVDTLVLQLNRIYPQILSNKEAHRVTTDNIWHQTNILLLADIVQACAVIPFSVCLSAVQEPKRAHQSAAC